MGTDDGYFGPDSVTWRLHGEPVSLVAGLRALFLQALHPEAMAKLVEVSSFLEDPWPRLRRTGAYVGVVTFGSRLEADQAAARVRELHQRLGIGEGEQMGWVHACLVDSFLAVGHAAGLGLGPGDADRYVAEQVRAAELAGVPDAHIVHNVSELDALMRERRPDLRATRDARRAARFLLCPPLPRAGRQSLPIWLSWTLAAQLATGLLPCWARRMYWMPPLPGVGLATTVTLRTLHGLGPILPAPRPSRPRPGPAAAAAAAAQP